MTIGTPSFPAALDDAVSLFANARGAESTLNGDLASGATTVALVDASTFASSGVAIINPDAATFEVIYYTGKSSNNLTGVTRAQEGTAQLNPSLSGSRVAQVASAGLREVLRDSLVLTQTKLGYGTGTPTQGDILQGDATSGTSRWGQSLERNGANLPLAVKTYGTTAFASWNLRRARGTQTTPLRTKSGDNLGRFGWAGFNAADDVTTASEDGANRAYMTAIALEDHTATAQGARIDLYATPATTTTPIQTMSIDGAIGVTFFKPIITSGPVRDVRNYASLQAAIDVGAGRVLIAEGQNYNLASVVTLKASVELIIAGSCTWTGSAGGTMFTTSTTDPTQKIKVTTRSGGYIDPGGSTNGADFIFDVISIQFCYFADLEIKDARNTTTVFRIRASATNATGYESNRNAVFNVIERIHCGNIGTFLDTAGQASPGGVATECSVNDIECQSVRVKGINYGIYSDNWHFGGRHRYSLQANNAIGVDIAGDPTCYSFYGEAIAVDTFTGGGYTGRIGVRLGSGSKLIVINEYHNDPVAEGGAIVDNGCTSWWIRGHALDTAVTGGWLEIHSKGTAWVRSDIYTISDQSGTDALIKAENTGLSGSGKLWLKGKAAGGTITDLRAWAGDGYCYIGTMLDNALIFLQGNNEVMRLGTGHLTVQWADAVNQIFGTTTGTKLGTATSQKLSLWNATPDVQPTTGITAAAFVANTSGTVNDSATYGGYTVGQVVAALKRIGALA